MPDPNQNQATPQNPPPPQNQSSPQNTGVQWDSTPDPAKLPAPPASVDDLISEGQRLGGPLGGALLSATAAAANHVDTNSTPTVQWDAKPDQSKFLGVSPAGQHAIQQVRYSAPGQGVQEFTQGSDEEKAFLSRNPQAKAIPVPAGASGKTAPSYTAQANTPYQQAEAARIDESNRKALKAAALGGAVMAGAVAGPAAFEAVGGGLLGSVASGAAAGGASSVAQQTIEGKNPASTENLEDTALQTGIGAATGGLFYAGGRVYQLVHGVAQDVTDSAVAQQGAKDAIRKVLGSKADAEITQDAYDLLENKVPRNFSNPENELKLIKPKIDARLTANNAALDQTLAASTTPIENVAAQTSRVFDSAIEDIQKSVSINKETQIAAINEVKNSVLPRLQNEMTPQEVTDVKRLVGDEIKKFAAPEMLDTPQKAAQEAYRQTYFKLRDMVSDAVPKSATLNNQISTDINLQDMLEKKFPQLDTPDVAQKSYDAVRQAGKRAMIKKVASRAGLGVAGVEGLRMLSHSPANPFGSE